MGLALEAPSFWLAQRELNSDLACFGPSWFNCVQFMFHYPLFPFLLETQMIHMWVLHSTGSAFLQADLKGDEGTIAIVLDGCCTPCLAWSWFIAVSFHPVNPNLHQLGNLIPGLWKTEVGHGCCWGGNIGVVYDPARAQGLYLIEACIWRGNYPIWLSGWHAWYESAPQEAVLCCVICLLACDDLV